VGGPGTTKSTVVSGPCTIESRAIDLVAEGLTGLLDGLCDTLARADIVTLTRALSGLGPGLTPTGDDLLVGISAACHRLVAGGYWSAVRRDALVDALAGMGDTGTTTVAREMVGEAAAGRFPEVLASFVELLGDRDTVADQVQAAAGRLAAIGAHSGADMLAGVMAVAARACREGTTR
jgi:transposase